MDYFTICLAALTCAGLTLFSGFGLGTMLMPVFAVFFPVDFAIALTAVVHLANNLFKTYLFKPHIETSIVIKFGLPAVISAFAGAWFLIWLSNSSEAFQYSFFGKQFEVLPVKFVVSLLIFFFVLIESLPLFSRIKFSPNLFFIGGSLSGFFGGLSGHQGALRSAFLIKCGLSKEAFIGTGVAIGCMVDLARLLVYGVHFREVIEKSRSSFVLLSVIASALIGSWIATRFLKKVRMEMIRRFVSVMLLVIAVCLGLGII